MINKNSLERKKRLIMSVWGKNKVGKSHFGFTCPEPLYSFNFDLGIEEIMHKFKNKEIYYTDYVPRHCEMNSNDARIMLNEFITEYTEICKTKPKGTIIIDTCTQLWQIVQKVYLDDIEQKREKQGKQLYPFDYAYANVIFQNTINLVKPTNLNMVLIHRAKEKYNQVGNRTGIFEPQDNSAIGYLVQVEIRIEKIEGKRIGTIESCRFDPKLEGATQENITYDDVFQAIFEGGE